MLCLVQEGCQVAARQARCCHPFLRGPVQGSSDQRSVNTISEPMSQLEAAVGRGEQALERVDAGRDAAALDAGDGRLGHAGRIGQRSLAHSGPESGVAEDPPGVHGPDDNRNVIGDKGQMYDQPVI
jgi:hypothetical protein